MIAPAGTRQAPFARSPPTAEGASVLGCFFFVRSCSRAAPSLPVSYVTGMHERARMSASLKTPRVGFAGRDEVAALDGRLVDVQSHSFFVTQASGLTVYGVDRNGSLAGYKTPSSPLR